MKSNLTHLSIVLFSIVTCAVRAQTDQELVDVSSDAANRVDTISTNRPGELTEAEFRRGAVAELAAATNAGFEVSREPVVRSASPNGPRPPARWVWGADNRFTTENTVFQATLAGDLNTTGALKVDVPGAELGTHLVSTIVGLAYCEPGDDAASVFLARTKSSQGELVGLDKVVFSDAMEGDGVVADVVIQISDHSIAQDVVIRGRLPGPDYYSDSGVSSNAYLAVVTEFFDSSAPRIEMVTENSPDQTLQWGRMAMVRGKAFSLNDDSDPGVEVDKAWIEDKDSSSLLLEYVPHHSMKDRIEALPILKPLPTKHGDGQGSLGPMRTPETLLAGLQNPFTPFWAVESPVSICPLATEAQIDPTLLSAAINRGEAPGLVIDYIVWYQPLINIDFGVGALKTGPAAIGLGGPACWNQFHFPNSYFATLTDLAWSDGYNSSASVTVENAPGLWGFSSTSGDPMYDGFIYPFSGNATVAINSIPPGIYDLYIYGHSAAQNGNTWFALNVPSIAGPLSTATSGTLWQTNSWQEGAQYIKFPNVNVGSGQQIRFTATAGLSGYTYLNGMQIAPTLVPAAPVFTLQPENRTINQGDSVMFSVSASRASSYLWYLNGSALPGANGSSCSVINAQPAQAGTYYVVASNSTGSATSGSATLTINAPSGGVPAPPGLVGWWKAEGNYNDTAGVNNGVNYTVDFVTGKVGSAFNLEGGNDHVQVPNDPAKPALRLSTGATFEAWVYPTASGSQLTILSKWDTIGGYDQRSYGFAINPNGTFGIGVCWDGTANNTAAVNSSSTVPLNQWSQLAGTYDGTALRVYLNGALAGTTPYTAGIFPSTCDFTIGGAAGQPSVFICPFIGMLDEVSVYNRALSQTEIQGIYNAGSSGKCTPPAITTQPQSQTVTAWSGATFTVGVNGMPPINYQWKFNGTDIAGATGSSYTRQHAEPTHAGVYSVYVSNAAGNATSSGASLTVNEANADADSLPDWWEMKYFGNLARDGAIDYDGDLQTDAEEYAKGTDPNTIRFSTSYTDDHVSAASVSGTIEIHGGEPAQIAILVNSEDFSHATWSPYSVNFTASLPTPNLSYQVWVGLRGLSQDSQQTWDCTTIYRDTAPPVIVITSPTSTTTSQPVLQLKGYSSEGLLSLRYDVANASGTLTEQEGYVTDKYYDSAQERFTTTWFECVDIELASGPNTITLRAPDLAGNVTTAVYTYTLDVSSDHTPPALTLYWPQSGARLSGSSFTLRGSLDDPTATVTARIVDGSGVATDLSGLVERNGLLWVEDLPLSTGTHTLTLTMTDANNNISTSILTLEASTVVITIDDVSASDLNQPTIPTVTGTINTPGYAVWINGVRATVNPNGTWIAADVPLPAGGTAVVQARASANCENGGGSTPTYLNLANPPCPEPIDAERQIEKPPFWYGSSYRETWSQEIFYEDLWPRDYPERQNYTLTWLFGQGGTGQFDAYLEPWQNYPDPTPGPNHFYSTETWPMDSGWEPTKLVSVAPGDDYDGDAEPYQMAPFIPLEHCGVFDKTDGPPYGDIYVRSAQTGLKLRTGGKAGVQRKNLFTLSGSADEIKDKRWQPRMGPPVAFEAIPPGQVQIGQLGPLGNDGLLYKVLPDNQTLDVTPRVANKKYYSFTVSPQKHRLQVLANEWPLASDRVVPHAKFCVGQRIEFATRWSPEVAGLASQVVQWQLDGSFINDWWQHRRWVVTPPFGGYYEYYGSVNYFKDPARLSQETTGAWWVPAQGSSPAIYNAQIDENLSFSNGQTVDIRATGLYQMYWPEDLSLTSPSSKFVVLDSSDPSNIYLGLGDKGGTGQMSWNVSYKLKLDDLFRGKTTYTQLINTSYAYDIDYGGNPIYHSFSTDGTYWLDNSEEFLTQNVIWGLPVHDAPFGDGPEISGGFHSFVDDYDIFKTYLRYKPDFDGAIYVTLGRIDWAWHGSASGEPWTRTFQSVTGPTVDFSDKGFPYYEKIYYNR